MSIFQVSTIFQISTINTLIKIFFFLIILMRIQCTNNKTLSKQNMVWSCMAEKNVLQCRMTGPIWPSTRLPPVPCYVEILFRKKTEAWLLLRSLPPAPQSPVHNAVTGHTTSLSICSSVSVYEIVWSLLNLLISLPLLPTMAKNSLPGVPENEGLFSFLCFKSDLLLPSLSAL